MDLNRKNMQKIALLILFTVSILVGLQKIEYVLAGLRAFFRLIMPFVIGGAIAFILNVPLRFLEKKLFPRRYGKHVNPLYRMRRVLSLILTLVLVVAALAVVLMMVIPEMARSIMTLGGRFSDFTWTIAAYLNTLAQDYPEIVAEAEAILSQWRNIDWKQLSDTVYRFFESGHVLSGTFSIASSIIGSIANFIIGFVFAIYALLQKERLGSQCKRTLYAFVPERTAKRFLDICQLSSDTFSNFISGQCLEAVILGCMFFVSMSIFHMPYALIISVLITVTALIPIFGTLLACAVGVFLILIVNPMQALWFLILFLVLQQIEGNLIYPHVVGNSVGLPSMWVLVAVTLGASTMGIVGMIINIPLFSVLYTLLRQSVSSRLDRRNISCGKKVR